MKRLQEKKEKEAADKAKAAAAAAAAKAAAPKTAPPPAEDAPGIMSTIMDNIPMVGGVVLAIGAVIWLMKKKKKEA
jgi:LPXTG-motif cell wall-anchored protein